MLINLFISILWPSSEREGKASLCFVAKNAEKRKGTLINIVARVRV